ncbi:MAG: 3'(2'),5'-bisphosphate nucleotidase [Alphaproteobacteria bacterium]|nr:3'(2'),5'-bisphosphate nucleotidase [Alphaproteobacteria bacterium]
MSAERARLLDAALAAALDAGRAILEVYASGDAGTTRKPDGSPVTEADKRAEAIIERALLTAAPEVPLIAEESVAQGRVTDISGKRFWLVDPLDGTREYLARNGEFCVSIGLIEDGRPVLGVLHGPVLGLTYAGFLPDSAWRIAPDGARTPIRVRAAPKEGLTVMVSRSHRDQAKIRGYLGPLRVAAMRVMGSALKLGLVAAGEADIYPRLGPTCEWDVAGGEAILLAAGGSLARLDGKPLAYGKPRFLNPEFVARGQA